MNDINLKVSSKELMKIGLVVDRVMALTKKHGIVYHIRDARLDITACHANGCKLNFDALLAAKDSDFLHDVLGIKNHINRDTGILEDFSPRFAAG